MTDRLWFFSNARLIKQEQLANFIPWTDPWRVNHDTYNWTNDEKMAFIKLTGQVSSNIKVMAMYNFVDRYRPMYEQPGSRTIFQATRVWDHETGHTGTALLSYILDQNTFFDIKGSFDRHWFPLPMQPEAQGLPRERDYSTVYGYFTTARFNETYLRKRAQVEAHFTRFQDNFIGGNQEIKGGVEFEDAYGDWDWWRKDNLIQYNYNGPYYYGTTTHNGVENVGRGRIYFYICSDEAGKSKIQDKARRVGSYYRFFTNKSWGRYANIRPPSSWCTANNVSREYYGVYVEPMDSRQNRAYNYLDLRLEKEFRIGDFVRLGACIDVLNVLSWSGVSVGRDDIYQYNPYAENVNEPENVRLEKGYKVISSVSGVRTFKFSIRFSF